MKATKFIILYAEDDLDDVELVRECFAQYSDLIELLHVENGKEALTALSHLKAKGIEPSMVILDINMPQMDGRQALAHIKSEPVFKSIPVVMFTTSDSQGDKSYAQKWGASFITKPLKLQDIYSLAERLAQSCRENILKKP